MQGEAGMGKTRLVDELRDSIAAEGGGPFISGKCFSGENKTPYGPFRDAMNAYLRIFKHYDPERQRVIRESIREKAGDLGEILLRLNPLMKDILGECPPLVELEPDRENKRFLMVVGGFFKNLSDAEGSLVILLEDLHWTDRGTVELLDEILLDIAKVPLLVIGTFRGSEAGAGHPLRAFIDAMGKYPVPPQNIELDQLGGDDIKRLVAGILFQEEETMDDIADFILRKGQGNPFFSIEILKQMVRDGALERRKKRWEMNGDALSRLEISSSLVEIVMKRIAQLEKWDMEVLSYAAALGRQFDMALLFRLLDSYSKEDVVAVVDRALALQLIEESVGAPNVLLFAHDRIRDAFDRTIDAEKSAAIHGKIAETLEEMHRDSLDIVSYELVHHTIKSGNRDKTLVYAIPAGRKARESYANEEAIRYYSLARDILEERGLEGSHPWVECLEGIGEVYLLIGKSDEAIGIFTTLLEYKETAVEQALVYKNITEAYFKKGNFIQCEENGRKGLAILGEKIPTGKADVFIGLGKELAIHIGHTITALLGGKIDAKSHDPKYNIIVLFYKSLMWSYILTNLFKMLRSQLRVLNLCESKIGKSVELGMVTASYAGICQAIPLFNRSLKYHTKALRIKEEFNDQWGIAQSYQFIGYYYKWKGMYATALDYLNKSVSTFRKIGDIHEAAIVMAGIGETECYLSNYYKTKDAIEEYLQVSNRTKDDYGISAAYMCSMQYLYEQGDYNDAIDRGMKSYTISRDKNIAFVFCEVNIHLGIAFLEKGDIENSLVYLTQAKYLYERNTFLRHYTVMLYPFLALAYIQDFNARKSTLSRPELNRRLLKIKRACAVALAKTRPWTTHYGVALRAQALYHALANSPRKAESFFLASIEHNDRLGRRYEIARSLFDYGAFLDANGKAELARRKWESARRIFTEIGARAYAQKTVDLLGLVEEDSTITQRFMDRQRLSSVIKVSQDISSILNLDTLLEIVMGKAIEVTGAQRGFLFIYDEKAQDLMLKAYQGVERIAKADFSTGIIHQAFEKDMTIITTNAEQDERLLHFESVRRMGLKSILCVPLRYHVKVIGVCYLDNPLSAGVFTHEDAELMSVFMNQAAIAIENAYLYNNLESLVDDRTRELQVRTEELEEKSRELGDAYEKLNETYDIMKKDLFLARRIQENILPEKTLSLGGLRLHAEYLPLIEVGGDIFDYFLRDDGTVRVFLADATGHGVVASLVTMLIKSEYEKVKNDRGRPSDVLARLNDVFFRSYRSLKIFFTGIIIDIDVKKGRFTYGSAGHPDQYLLHDGAVVELPNTGRAVALHHTIDIENRTMKFSPDDRLLVFTDGIFEEFNSSQEQLGEERIKKVIAAVIGEKTADIIRAIIRCVNEHTRDSQISDDITIIGIERG
ncbi:MAG TPA: SpoIIE family protein phosphatase [Spirochaetota bacterium]|nr:SpoIIE family protein phosphatase [Spirochaetota bacterium]